MNVLYTLEHDVSLGDSLTNFHQHLSPIKFKFPDCNIYAIIHPRTYNAGVHEILLNQGLIDFVFPFPISNIDDSCNFHYKQMLKSINFGYVIYNKHLSNLGIDKLVDTFPMGTHLETNDVRIGFQNLNQFLSIEAVDYPKIISESYTTNYIEKFLESCNLNGKKSIGLFTNSTRHFSNMTHIGVSKIIECASENGIFTYILGTKKSNLYNKNGIYWDSTTSKSYPNSRNLIGTGWNKTLAIMQKLDAIITPPTGAAMIPPILHKKVILLNGGDSPIMTDCLKSYTDNKFTYPIPCLCENYPCHDNFIKNETKYIDCKCKIPACLNGDLNIGVLNNVFKIL